MTTKDSSGKSSKRTQPITRVSAAGHQCQIRHFAINSPNPATLMSAEVKGQDRSDWLQVNFLLSSSGTFDFEINLPHSYLRLHYIDLSAVPESPILVETPSSSHYIIREMQLPDKRARIEDEKEIEMALEGFYEKVAPLIPALLASAKNAVSEMQLPDLLRDLDASLWPEDAEYEKRHEDEPKVLAQKSKQNCKNDRNASHTETALGALAAGALIVGSFLTGGLGLVGAAIAMGATGGAAGAKAAKDENDYKDCKAQAEGKKE